MARTSAYLASGRGERIRTSGLHVPNVAEGIRAGCNSPSRLYQVQLVRFLPDSSVDPSRIRAKSP